MIIKLRINDNIYIYIYVDAMIKINIYILIIKFDFKNQYIQFYTSFHFSIGNLCNIVEIKFHIKSEFYYRIKLTYFA